MLRLPPAGYKQGAQNMKLDPNTINLILKTLDKGHRVELIPVKDGIKVIRIRREELNRDSRP